MPKKIKAKIKKIKAKKIKASKNKRSLKALKKNKKTSKQESPKIKKTNKLKAVITPAVFLTPPKENVLTLKQKEVILLAAPPEPSTPKLIRRQSAQPSPYVLDLRKIEEDKSKSQTQTHNYAQIIGRDLNKSFNNNSKNFKKYIQSTIKSWQTNLQKITVRKTSSPLLTKVVPRQRQRIREQIALAVKPVNAEKIKSLKLQTAPTKISLPKIKAPKLQLPQLSLGTFTLPTSWAKTISGFMLFCLVFVAPFYAYDYYQNLLGKKSKILNQTADALWHLTVSQKAASAQDFYYTSQELQAATEEFSQAQNEFGSINAVLQKILAITPELNQEYLAADNLLNAAEKLSHSATIISATLEKIKNNPLASEKLNLTDKLLILKDNLNLILPELKQANTDLQAVSLDSIPAQYQPQIAKLQKALPILVGNVDDFVAYSDLILKVLGNDIKKRYLVLFQNNNEIRPSGGFIGSFAVVDIDRGNIEKINIPGGGPYDLKAGLKVSVASPTPLHLVNPRWEFQDSNWFADFPTSAEKIMWFYEKSGGASVDGLITINATLLAKILGIIGPVELPQYGKTITQQNFIAEIQNEVELNYDKVENKPKQIIADLTPLVINKLLNADKKEMLDIIDLLFTSLNEKEVQLYFNNFTLEKLVLKNGWGGEIKKADRDYLNVVSTNIAGEKTDAKIKQSAKLNVAVSDDGSMVNTLTITKTHTGQEGEPFYGVPNLDYLRIYVPHGSELISITGQEPMPAELFSLLDPEIYTVDSAIAQIDSTKQINEENNTEIYSENDKTVFANWFKVNPGETKSLTIKYKLPFQLELTAPAQETNYLKILKDQLLNIAQPDNLETYSLLWQKQSGRNDFSITTEINFPQRFNYQAVYPETSMETNNSVTFSQILNSDQLMAVIFEQK